MFTVAEDGTATRAQDDTELSFCTEMGGIATSKDGQVIGVLCRSATKYENLPTDVKAKATDLVAEHPDRSGWVNDMEDRDDTMYLLEFIGGIIESVPSRTVAVNKAIGGWDYGMRPLNRHLDIFSE